MKPENNKIITNIYKGTSRKKGNGKKFILTMPLFPSPKSEKNIKKKKKKKTKYFFNFFGHLDPFLIFCQE